MTPEDPTPAAGHDCGSCVVAGASAPATQRLGRRTLEPDVVVALAGNPSSGKTTLFNNLTGLRQRVGNWPGTTVARAEGSYRRHGRTVRVVDLPGITSVVGVGDQESVARKYLLEGRADVCLVVLDVTLLERHLYLGLQLLQIAGRVVVALNMMDEADRAGLRVDVRHLTRELGVAVVPISARRGHGLPELMAALDSTSHEPRRSGWSPRFEPVLESATRSVAKDLSRAYPGLSADRWVAQRLLAGDAELEDAVRRGTVGAS